MKLHHIAAAWLVIAGSILGAQVASHGPSTGQPEPRLFEKSSITVTDKPVARVNGTLLTDRDLLREMYAIFPYARQHNGFPKGMEGEIRKGALEMIIFDELVYQEAQRRKVTVSAERIAAAQTAFRRQFSAPEQYQQYLQAECQGSAIVLRRRIRRSLIIEALLQTEVKAKAVVTPAELKSFYDRNPQQFQRPETFSIQTISIIPPDNTSPSIQQEAGKRAQDALKRAKATKNYREFGLLAESISDDDWHVNMGDRKTVNADALPPPLVEAARKMKPGDVSDLLQFGPNYTLFRLNAHSPAHKATFRDVKAQLTVSLGNAKLNQVRSDLNRRLHTNAKVEIL
jgi:peptidyl-prolyl cis-trans isomerase C